MAIISLSGTRPQNALQVPGAGIEDMVSHHADAFQRHRQPCRFQLRTGNHPPTASRMPHRIARPGGRTVPHLP